MRQEAQADKPEAESDNIFINEEEVVSSFLDPIYALQLEKTNLYPEELITIFDELLRHRQQEGKRARQPSHNKHRKPRHQRSRA